LLLFIVIINHHMLCWQNESVTITSSSKI